MASNDSRERTGDHPGHCDRPACGSLSKTQLHRRGDQFHAAYAAFVATAPVDPQQGAVPGLLYVVATPIGNLEDITFRALRTLREVDVIAAEHLDGARPLLAHFEIDTPVIPYHDRGRDAQRLVQRLLSGESVALICDAGTPSVSDPGRRLVRAAMDAGVRVSPIPGPASSIALWSVSGSELASVWLRGFLPRRAGASPYRARARSRRWSTRTMCLRVSAPAWLETLARTSPVCMPDAQLVDRSRTDQAARAVLARIGPSEAQWTPSQEPRGEFTILIVPLPGAEAA